MSIAERWDLNLGLRLMIWVSTAWFLTPLAQAQTLSERPGSSQTSWAYYQNKRFGFSISYPEDVFSAVPKSANADGQIWASHDGRARLIASAGQNSTTETIASYRDFVKRESYPGARFDYTPMRSNWFVLSGQQGDQMFYERITFACGGTYIYGWQMVYPASERRLYDRVVEAVHRSYRPGRGEDGTCK